MNWIEFSGKALLAAFLIYCAAFVLLAIAVGGKRWSNRDPQAHARRWGNIGFGVAVVGFLAHAAYFVTRWIGSGHSPNSNMYEFITMLALAVMLAYIVVFLIYRNTLLGAFAVPLVILLIAYAAVFPSEVQPLIPSLDSIWLRLHVTLAALGEAFFAVGFAAALVYLLRVVDFSRSTKRSKRAVRWTEFTLLFILIIVGFVISVFGFRAAGYEVEFRQAAEGQEAAAGATVKYTLPPIAGPHGGEVVSGDSFLGLQEPLFQAPSWMEGVNAGRKLNTVIWSVLSGLVLYGLLRLLFRKPLGAVIQPYLSDINPEDLDEISYRAIAIGYPIFTLGGLIFAMIWAEIAWSRFWGWDPKEVWALITFLFYTAYLHLRLSRGWHGTKSSWLAVIGFLIVLFTLIGVNLVIAGLHSYAGVT